MTQAAPDGTNDVRDGSTADVVQVTSVGSLAGLPALHGSS
jgi:hypothetical protein